MLVLPRKTLWKPSGGMPILRGHPLAHELRFHARCDTPGQIYDLVDNVPVPWNAGTSISSRVEGVGTVTDATTEGATRAAPTRLQLTTGTLVWRGLSLGAATNRAALVEVSYTTSDLPPYVGYGIMRSSTAGTIICDYNDGVDYRTFNAASVLTDNVLATLAFTFRSGQQNLWKNGLSVASATITGNQIYSNPQLVLSNYTGDNRNANCWTDAVWIYGRVLTPTELVWLHREPWSMYQHPSSFGNTVSAVVAANLRMLMGMGT